MILIFRNIQISYIEFQMKTNFMQIDMVNYNTKSIVTLKMFIKVEIDYVF